MVLFIEFSKWFLAQFIDKVEIESDGVLEFFWRGLKGRNWLNCGDREKERERLERERNKS